MSIAVDPELLELLRCPIHPDGPKLKLVGQFLICQVDGLGYRIIDGIPDMLVEDSVDAASVNEELRLAGLVLADQEN